MTHTINNAGTVAVALDVHWLPIDKNTPRGVKLQLISKPFGVATYGNLPTQVTYFTHWAPLPKWRKDEN